MNETESIRREAHLSLKRLLPRLEQQFSDETRRDPEAWSIFRKRVDAHFPRLFRLYHNLYSGRYDFFYHLEDLVHIAARMWLKRSGDLKELDRAREQSPLWASSNHVVGGVLYVDLFAGTLGGIREKIPYFKELGINYLHLMPLFRTPEGEDDGGYAVSNYREIDPQLGTMEELCQLARVLRGEGISLVLDFVFNHTAYDHSWAILARQGDEEHLSFYRTFPDRTMPDAYEKHLREIFPEEHPGAFTYVEEIDRWVWTTFHSYQWDLNYANPAVFNRMAEELLFLANIGVEVMRLDAVAFIWKQLGTDCENLPQAHKIIQAYNALMRIGAPAMLFKSEAIVHPDEVARYIHPEECQISYNPLVMAMLWNSLATRDIRMLRQALIERFDLPPETSWVNYVRSHDDIGWTFSDEDAARLDINAYDHRRFLNDFYTGRFPGSFARGLPFQENPATGDVRISGTTASLAGLEKALNEETEWEVTLAIRRILLNYGIALTLRGVPLMYLGDELGTLNDYSYRNDPSKAHDSRWVHRPPMDWMLAKSRHNPETVQGRVFQGMQELIHMRRNTPAFGEGRMEVMDLENLHVLGYVRTHEKQRVLVFANFSEAEQLIPANNLRLYGLSYHFRDLLSGEQLELRDLHLEPYDFLCLEA